MQKSSMNASFNYVRLMDEWDQRWKFNKEEHEDSPECLNNDAYEKQIVGFRTVAESAEATKFDTIEFIYATSSEKVCSCLSESIRVSKSGEVIID